MAKLNKVKSKFLIVLMLVFFILFALVMCFVLCDDVYAEEIYIGYKEWDKDYWKSNFSWKNMLRPKYTRVTIYRIGEKRYRATGNIYMAYANAGVGWWEFSVLVDGQEIIHEGKVNSADRDWEFSVEFNHSDVTDFSVKTKVLSNWSDTTVVHTSNETTMAAYDKAAPTIKLSGVQDGEITNKDVTIEASDVGKSGLKEILVNKNSSGYTSYSNNKVTLSEDGFYNIYAKDNVGNESSKYSFTLDKSKPVVKSYKSYTNEAFDFEVTDMLDVTIEYKLNNGTIRKVKQKKVHIDLSIENYGCWQFKATDAAGNTTNWETINLYKRTDFQNLEQIKNSYNLPTWYVVKLPAKVYFDCAGNYSFAKYEYALDFAIKKEWEYRVVNIGNGKWSYVNVGNESVSQIYDNKTILDNAILKYAKSYISDRKIFDGGSSNYDNPTDENGISRPDALISQNVELPEHLSKYIGLPRFFIKHDFTFAKPHEGVAGNKSYVKIKWISDGIMAQNGKEINVPYNAELRNVLESEMAWKQGYYLVTEYDECGNSEQYIVCLDAGNPTVSAEILLGNGTTQTITYDIDYVQSHQDVMLYLSFDMQSFYDAIDEFIFVYIEGRKLSQRYIVGDELPVLCYENGYWGNYTVTIYDRSLNILQFTIRIAGEPPKINHTSTTNETKFVLSIVNNDTGNGLTNVELFRVTYDGEYIKLLQDDLDNLVSPDVYSYTLKNGGKYVLRFTDIFGRTVETEPVFYMKGLPSGTLKGVKENATTNKDVTFEYEKDCGINLYVFENGNWVNADELMILTEKEYFNMISIAASVENSKIYKIFLYKLDDMNLFVEYRFEIDCVPPIISLKSVDGNILEQGITTNKSFFVFWNENNIKVYYYRVNDPLGSMGETQYTKESVITLYGEYIFTAYDAVGNVSKKSITLDNIVDYEIEGNYQRLDDGSLISKNRLKLTVKERIKQFECFSSNGINIANGMYIDVDGTYIFSIVDMFDNEIEVIIIIDNLPPMPIITTINGDVLEQNTKTNQSFKVECNEANIEILVTDNNGVYIKYTGDYIEKVGIYSFKLIDRMNNAMVFNIVIDKSVDFVVSGNYLEIEDKVYLSKSTLVLSVNEEIKHYEIASSKGNTFVLGDKITIEDVYIVTIEDLASNITIITLEIDKTPPEAQINAENGDVLQKNTITNKSFLVFCNEELSKIKYCRDNKNFAAYTGELLQDGGKYYFEISDRIGNTTNFWIVIDGLVEYEIKGKYNVFDGVIYSRYGVIIEAKENITFVLLKSENGSICDLGEKIDKEDIYTILLKDDNGNETTLEIVIDYQKPVVELDGVNNENVSNSSVTVTIQDCETAKYRKNSTKDWIDFVSGMQFEDHDYYIIIALDRAGNEIQVEFIIDKEVEVEPSIDLSAENRYITTNTSFKMNENMSSILLTKDGTEIGYNGGVIKDVGTYQLKLTDIVGNMKIFNFVILPAAAKEYKLNIPLGYKVIVTLDGTVYDAVIEGQAVLTKDGLYNMKFVSSDSEFDIEVRVDTVPPTVNIEKHKDKIIINNPSKDKTTIELYKNGSKIDYTLCSEIKAVGDYQLRIVDELGNVNEYEFSLNYINSFGIVVIVLGIALAIGIAVIIIFSRLKQKVK